VGGNHVDFQDPKDGKVFVATGDYPEMWIRDSAAQTWMCVCCSGVVRVLWS